MTSATTFIGVDLAWQSERNATGIVVARGEEGAATVIEVASGVRKLNAILSIVERFATANTVVAIDAPLIIRNTEGCRPCESAISRRFSAKHASAHSSNLRRYPEPCTHELVRQLECSGFRHHVATKRRAGGRWFFEVYPHPAHIVLFDLDTIIKYKAKSRRARSVRLSEFKRLQSLLVSLQHAEPALAPGAASPLLDMDLHELRGQQLKDHEDALDAWFCSYLAMYVWYWGSERNEVVGDFETGYIVVPRTGVRSTAGDPCPNIRERH